MSDVKFEPVVVDLPAGSSGFVDATIPGFGTPKAAIVIVSNAQAIDTLTTIQRLSIGFTDGVRVWCSTTYSADVAATARTARYQTSNTLITLLSRGSPTDNPDIAKAYNFDSWVTDGVRIAHDSGNTSVTRKAIVILIGGDDVADAYVNFKDDLGTGTSPVAITEPGFEPSTVFCSSVNSAEDPTQQPAGASALLSFGQAINDGLESQRCFAYNLVNNTPSSNNHGTIANDAFLYQVSASGLISYKAPLTSFDASGFSVTPSASAGNDIMGYLALRFTNSPNMDLVDITWPTSGDLAVDTLGFEPDFVMTSLLSAVASRNLVSSTFVIGAMLSAQGGATEAAIATHDQDGVNTTNTGSYYSDSVTALNDAGTVILEAAGTFDADGVDYAISTNPPAATLGWLFGIGNVSSGGITFSADVQAGPADIDTTTILEHKIVATLLATSDASVDVTLELERKIIAANPQAGPADIAAAIQVARQIVNANVQAGPADIAATITVSEGTEIIFSAAVQAADAVVSALLSIGRKIVAADVQASPADLLAFLVVERKIVDADVVAGPADVDANIFVGSIIPVVDAHIHGVPYSETKTYMTE